MGKSKHPLLATLAVLAAWTAFATQGTHVETEDLREMIEQVKVEVPVIETVEVVREVEVPAKPPAQTVSLGYNREAQGCVYPGGVEATQTVMAGYEFKYLNFSFSGHGVDKPRGSDCRRQGLNIDALGKGDFDFWRGTQLTIAIGHDQHGVTGFDKDNTLVFGTVTQSTVAAMVGRPFDVPNFGEVDIKAGWNLAARQPRASVAFGVGEHFKFAAECNGTDGGGPYCDASLCGAASFGADGPWGVRACYEHSNGLEYLPDPFSGRADAPAANEVNTFRVSLTRTFGG